MITSKKTNNEKACRDVLIEKRHEKQGNPSKRGKPFSPRSNEKDQIVFQQKMPFRCFVKNKLKAHAIIRTYGASSTVAITKSSVSISGWYAGLLIRAARTGFPASK